MAAEDYSNLSVQQKISALVRGIEGDERWNAALAKAPNAEAMLDLLESAANKLKLGLSRTQSRPPGVSFEGLPSSFFTEGTQRFST